MIILEEAAYCDPGLVSEVVVPLLSMQQSVLLCISTILDSGNHYTKMMELQDDYGKPVFETIKITLVCDDCMKTEHPERCRHKLASMPRWLSSQKVETVRKLLAEDPAMLLRESLGISADGSEKAFPGAEIEAMIARTAPPIPYNIRAPSENTQHAFIAVDPSGGGASAFSIASLVCGAQGFFHIVGVDALHTRDVRHTHRLLIKHVLALRNIPILAHTKAVFIFESNLAFESQHLLHALEAAGVKNWVSLSEGQAGSLGWLTTNERKEQMCLLLREAMTMGRIALSNYFFSVELNIQEAKKRIKDELLNYCVVTEAPKTTFGKVRKTYTGKLYGKQDDLCIAIQLAMIGCQKFFQDAKYRNFRADDFLTPQGLASQPRPRGSG